MTCQLFGGMEGRARAHPLVAVMLLVGGCGTALTTARVGDHFTRAFDCPHAKLSSDSGGYKVRGCGHTALYSCYSNSERDTNLAGELLVGELQHCTLIELDKDQEVMRAQRFQRKQSVDYGRLLLATLSAPGAHLTATALLDYEPNFIWVRVRREHGAFTTHRVHLLRDGEVIEVAEAQRVGSQELAFAVPVTGFRAAQRALKLTLVVDGLTVELNERAREKLALLEVELREQRALHDLAEAVAAP